MKRDTMSQAASHWQDLRLHAPAVLSAIQSPVTAVTRLALRRRDDSANFLRDTILDGRERPLGGAQGQLSWRLQRGLDQGGPRA